jgi:hypothetical protein
MTAASQGRQTDDHEPKVYAAFDDFNWVLMQDNARHHICKAMMETLSNLNGSAFANWPVTAPASTSSM